MDAQLATPADVIRLWPDGPPDDLGVKGEETGFSGLAGVSAGTAMLRNISDPTLSVFRPPPGEGNGIGVIICPGGGWRILAWEHEGLDLAHWLTERGYTACLLKYRVMPTTRDPEAFAAAMAAEGQRLAEPIPGAQAPRRLSDLIDTADYRRARAAAHADGRRALALVREHAAAWGLRAEAIGMVGFSAGAFLTADVATDPQGPPLAFAAPIYGGDTAGRPVPPDAPPLFTVIAHDDRLLFRVVEGLYADWTEADRPAELHIFARGGHGFGMIRQGLPADRWIELFEAWLADLGFA